MPCSATLAALASEHQLRDVDVRRAFHGAHLAIYAQVGHLRGTSSEASRRASVPSLSKLRIRLALARGVAASTCVTRKIRTPYANLTLPSGTGRSRYSSAPSARNSAGCQRKVVLRSGE